MKTMLMHRFLGYAHLLGEPNYSTESTRSSLISGRLVALSGSLDCGFRLIVPIAFRKSSHLRERSVPVSEPTPGRLLVIRAGEKFNSLLRSSYTASDRVGIGDAIIAQLIGARNLT